MPGRRRRLSREEKKRFLQGPEIHITLDAQPVQEILSLFPYRLPFNREFGLVGGGFGVVLFPSGENRHTTDRATLRLDVRPDTVAEIQSVLEPREGTYRLGTFKGLVIHVKKTEITDSEGTVVGTIG